MDRYRLKKLTGFRVGYPGMNTLLARDVIEDNIVPLRPSISPLEGGWQPLPVVGQGAHARHVEFVQQGIGEVDGGVES